MKNSSVIRITKEFSFEMAHALYGYDGPCKNIHGHSYKLSVTVIGKTISDPENHKSGMVMDFSELKKIIEENILKKFDHSLVLNENSPHKTFVKKNILIGKTVMVNYQPTCENLLINFADIISKNLPVNTKLHHLKLRETTTSFAEWFSNDQ
jgi:6-pyruvoyltetrahydropterin/6-carboxytetrahydropterin synthase